MTEFEHISVFLSFIYAMGVTRILETCTDLVNARKRVRWSGLHLAWMLSITLSLFVNWFSLFDLRDLASWPLHAVLLLFGQGVAQYFACSFVSVKVDDEGQVDMPALYEDQRGLFLSAAILITVFGMIRIWTHAASPPAAAAAMLTVGTLLNAAGIAARLVALFARSRVLQWAAVTAQFALLMGYLVRYWTS